MQRIVSFSSDEEPVEKTSRRPYVNTKTALDRHIRIAAITVLSIALRACSAHETTLRIARPESVGMSSTALVQIDAAVNDALQDQIIPGATVEIVHKGTIVYRKAFGLRALYPHQEPNTIDTIYDLASMTKPIATATAIMKLVELGRIRLWDRVAYDDPAFAAHGKEQVTIEELLDHSAGLPSALNERQSVAPPAQGEALIDAMKLHFAPGSRYEYCNTCFIELAKIVRIKSGMSIAQFDADEIFAPLGIADTMFFQNPRKDDDLISPEASIGQGRYLRGKFVIAGHGPIGAVGHAGLFANVDAVAIYAQMLLNGGTYGGKRILAPATIATMITPYYLGRHTQREGSVRGLGWDEATTDTSNRGELFGAGGFGHTGSTGCSLWIDPASETAIVFLSNAAHLRHDTGDEVVRLHARISTLAAAAIIDPQVSVDQALQASRWNAQVAAQAPGFEHWAAVDANLWQHTHQGTAY